MRNRRQSLSFSIVVFFAVPALLVVSPHASARARNTHLSRVRSQSASSDNLVANGSFESPSAGPNYTTYQVGDTFGGWTVGQNTVDHVGGWTAACGSQSVDLDGTGAGSVLQDLATTAGITYHVQFQLAGNPDGGSRVMTVEVWWDGQLLSTFTFDTTGHSGADMGWVREDIPATASGSSTRLEFRSLTDGSYGPVIDDVSVSTGPLPPCSGAPPNSCGSIQDVEPFGVPIDPVQGQATVTISDVWVASIVGPDTTPLSCYSASIDWGDGEISAGSIHPFVSGSLCELGCKVLGTHTYYPTPGHHIPVVDVSLCDATGCTTSIRVTDTDNKIELGVSPPTTEARPAVGVLTTDHGPQCTATVVDLAGSIDPGSDWVTRRIRKHRDDFNGNVVVTAAHCIDSRGGYMFAPGFTGIAPRYSIDWSTGTVSAAEDDPFGVGSPFEGEPIGEAPSGVWGCSHNRSADRHCGPGGFHASGFRDAGVIKPNRFTSGDNSYDYAFVVFRAAPPKRPRSLVDITGGMPVEFDADIQSGRRLPNLAYDVTWVDTNRPNDTSGWFDLVSHPETDGNCRSGPPSYREEDCTYRYLASSAGPRSCLATADGFFNLKIPPNDPILSESRPSLLASPCNSGGFASGAPFMIFRPGGPLFLVGVNKTTLHLGANADPIVAPGVCCTSIITPLRRDAAVLALLAELIKER